MSILELFCDVDDFCQWLSSWEDAKLFVLTGKRGPAPRLSLSEVMTILIHFHQSHYRNFKAYYVQHVCKHLCSEFPALVSYTRFVELIPAVLPAMCLYLRVRFGQGTGVAFIDSTPLPVYHNQRNRLVLLQDKLLTRKRFIIETIINQLKNISQIEHTRHRSSTNFLVNLIAGLIAYTWQPPKTVSSSLRK